MKWQAASEVVEALRVDTRLYLPALTKRRGFSSSRVEHLLNRLVKAMPADECYLEVGTLEGRTLEAASVDNDDKRLIGIDSCAKYETTPENFQPNVSFVQARWQDFDAVKLAKPVGLAFYDGDHSADETRAFMASVSNSMSREAVLVLDDWDRVSVRDGAFRVGMYEECGWRLLRELPEYGDGLTVPCARFGYSFGIGIWGFRRSQ